MTHLIPDTTADARLTGLERFLEFWLGPRRSDYGEPSAILDKLELPGSLRRFYAFAGRWPPAFPPYCMNRFHVQDRFLPLEPGSGSAYRSGVYFVFVRENQGVWEIATLPDGDDPGVWVSVDCSHRTSSPSWRILDCRLSQFLVTFVLQETMFGSRFVAYHENALAVFTSAGCQVEPIWLDGEFAWPEVRQSYFLVEGRIVVRHDTGAWAVEPDWYAFNDPEVAEFVERLNLPSAIS